MGYKYLGGQRYLTANGEVKISNAKVKEALAESKAMDELTTNAEELARVFNTLGEE
jgi:hypothetical protein